MGSYLLRRLLLMVPTLFGISMIVWLIMVAAPGRPGGTGQAMGETTTSLDPAKERAKGESQRIFRRHFALDRPVLWNGWTGLTEDEVLDAVRRAEAPVESAGIVAKGAAKERLEDWGYYSVPSLVRLLRRTEGREQDAVLRWLRLNSYRLPESAEGRALTAEQKRRNAEWSLENVEIAKYAWTASDPPPRRAQVVEQWEAWHAKHADRWSWGLLERLRVAVTDTQFGTYWSKVVRFDFGISHVHKRPVLDLIGERLSVSLILSVLALLISYALAIPIGIFSAVRPYTASDRLTTVALFMLYSLPSFFVGTLLLRTLTVGEPFRWFPNSGFQSEGAEAWDSWSRLGDILLHITLPLAALTYGSLAQLSRFARTGMLDVIRSDYVRTARAKGLPESAVVLRHAARNGMMPVITLLGAALPAVVGGSVVVEFIFNIQGMGMLMLDAITNKDYNVVMGETFIVAVLTLVGFLLSDLLYAVVDPRISYA